MGPWGQDGHHYPKGSLVVLDEWTSARANRRDWTGNEIRVSRAAKDGRTGGLVRGLKSRNAKTLPVDEYPLGDWLEAGLPRLLPIPICEATDLIGCRATRLLRAARYSGIRDR